MKNKNNDLAIAIPTYNRPYILQENILLMLDEIKKYNIPIYISDDSPNDETKNVILELRKEYEFIYYKKNASSLGHDKNCISTLQYPVERFVWYIGDSIIIEPGGIELILTHISVYNPDIISVNIVGRELDNQKKWYIDGNTALDELGWHLTCTGVTIYSKKLIGTHIALIDLSKCINFPQTALIFKGLESEDCKLYFENKKLIRGNSKKNSYWQKTIFNVFLRDWANFVNNLNFLSDENKKKVIVMHSRETGIFNLKSLLSYRMKGLFGLRDYVSFFKDLRIHSSVNILVILIIVLTPQFIFRILNKIRKF